MRTLDPAIESAIEGNYTEAWLIEFAFPSGSIYTTTADRAIPFGGDNYLPDGTVVSFIGPTERGDGRVQEVRFELSPTSAVIGKLTDGYQFRRATLYFTVLDSDHEVVDAPVKVGDYFMSHMEVRGADKTFAASLVCDSQALPFRRSNGVISSGSDQNARFAGDTAFSYTAKIEGIDLTWGGARARGGSYYTSDQDQRLVSSEMER